jgi:hypothetical protein
MARFLARIRALASDLDPSQRLSADDERLAMAAALLHDLGHGPLSHLFEEVFEAAPAHEEWTSAILLDPDSTVHRVLAAYDPKFPRAVERLVHGEHTQPYLARAVSGTFDVDRCDYLLRDSYMTGVRYGLYDLEWLLRALRLTDGRTPRAQLAVDGTKGLPAVEGFFLARLFMYQQVYFHKASRAAEVMVRMLFARAVDLVRDGQALDLPAPMLAMARREKVTAAAYGTLDDGAVWSAADRWQTASDPVLRNLSARLIERRLFKSVTLDEDDSGRSDALLEGLQSIATEAGFDPRYYTSYDVAEVSPYEPPADPGEALQVVYANRAARPLARASFLIGRLQGHTFRVRRLVFPGEVRDKVHRLLGRSNPPKTP